MTESAHNGQFEKTTNVRRGVINRLIQVVGILLIEAAILFISAGRVNWGMAWLYFGLYVLGTLIIALVVLPKNPELIAERGRVKENTKAWDKVLASLYSLFSTLALLTVTGLDDRFNWTGDLPLWLQLAGIALLALGFALICWSMAANRFFSGVVRIQEDRGHQVASGGPYRLMRHPGYIGMILAACAVPLMLSALWGLVPAGIVTLVLVIRTALEDRTLQNELEGYREYAQITRFRLIPGIW